MLILILATVDKAVLVNLYCGSTINVPPVHVFTVRTVGCTQKFLIFFFDFFRLFYGLYCQKRQEKISKIHGHPNVRYKRV